MLNLTIFEGLRGWASIERIKDIYNPISSSADAQLQPLDRFKQSLQQNLQVSAWLCSLRPEFENFASKSNLRCIFSKCGRIEITIFRVNSPVLIYLNLCLGTFVEAQSLC